MLKRALILCFVIQIRMCQFLYNKIEEKTPLNIVGLFDPTADIQMRAFMETMRDVAIDNVQVEPVNYITKQSDSYSVFRELCSNRSQETIAVFGPQSPISDGGVRSHCLKLHIPFIQAVWQSFDPDIDQDIPDNQKFLDENNDEEPVFKDITINFYPDADQVSVAYAKVIKYYNWESFVVLYEDDNGLLRVQKIVAEHSTSFPIIFRRIDPEDSYEVFKELSQMQESRILLDCHVDNLMKYMKIAETLNMVNPYQHYMLTTMDASKYSTDNGLCKYLSNFTWLSMTEYDDLNDIQHYLSGRVPKWVNDSSTRPPLYEFSIEALIMDDVANHVLKSLGSSNITRGTPLCGSRNPWELGAKLQHEILTKKTSGLTGNVQFDSYGRRWNYSLYLNEIHQKQMQPIAEWNSNSRKLEFLKKFEEIRNQIKPDKHFIVVSRMAEPYFVMKNKCTEEPCEEDEYPNEEYEGFSVDLVRNIFEVLRTEYGCNFTYGFIAEKDISYGKYDDKIKKWDGMIGKLLDKTVDLAVCDLTITEERKKLVDFSVPIMSLGISILFTKDVKVTPDMLSFLKPYTVEMWINTATAYCIVSIVLFVCSRISPADWENPQPCDKNPEELENIWNFKNCTWLTMGSIMTQGCDILPKAFGSRWVCAMWWFFAMIVCQTYIAQLAASMTTALATTPIDSVEDLAKQTKVLYGAFEHGSTMAFFKRSKDKMFQNMYENMLAHPGVLVESNEVGEKRVISGKNKYAFFMESVTIEYKQKRNCDLKKVGGELDSKDYGIAMPANSPYRSLINRAILKLKENNKLNDIKDKWWNTKFGAKLCEETKDANDVEGDLEWENLRGAFYVLIGGLFICLFITAAEFLNEVRNIVVREQVPHKEALVKELKASLNFFQLQKPVLRNPSRAPSVASSEKSDKTNKRSQIVENFIEFEKEP